MTVAVGNNQIAALCYQVDCRIITSGVFFYLVLPDNLAVGNTKCRCCRFDTVHVCFGIAFGFVAQHNRTDFDVGYVCVYFRTAFVCGAVVRTACCVCATAGNKHQCHYAGKYQTEYLFHFFHNVPPFCFQQFC